MRCSSAPLVIVTVLGGCRIDPPSADAYAGASTGSGSSESTVGASDGSGDDGGSGSGSSSGDDSTLTLGVDATETTGTTDVETTGPGVRCGDGMVKGDEPCDGSDLGGASCESEGFDAGMLACLADCSAYDTSGCVSFACGNGVLEPSEECDDTDLAEATCTSEGFDGGMLACDDSTCQLDTTGCFECGDGERNGAEQCDGGDLGEDSCGSQGYDGGVLGCSGSCTFDASGCHDCGDGVVNGLEQCDGGSLGGETCFTMGFDAGVLACSSSCTLDVSSCISFECGNGVIDGADNCDGMDLGGQTCLTQGFDGGALACTGGCTFDTFGCHACGDGVVNGSEQCDDGNLDIHDGCFASCEVPTSCVDIKAYDGAAPDGMYTIDADGGGGSAPFDVYCNMTVDGGGWQLVSVRYQDVGVLFADTVCTDIGTDCSGTIPDVQLVPGLAPDLLFATTDNMYWLRLTGLNPPGSHSLLDVITLDRVLVDTDSCSGDHYCGQNVDSGVMVADSSPNYAPRFINLPHQFIRYGGVWFGNGGGSGFHHVVSMNYSPSYCLPAVSGLQLSDDSNLLLGNVTCSQPGALYFRY